MSKEDRDGVETTAAIETRAVYANLSLTRNEILEIVGDSESYFDMQIARDALFDRLTGFKLVIRHRLDELEECLNTKSNDELIAYAKHHCDQKLSYVLSQRLKELCYSKPPQEL